MPPLPLNVDAVPGEHPISLASRLAARNGAPLREFLSDMSIRAVLLLEGDPDQLGSLADLAGQAPAELYWNAPQPAGKSVRFHADQFAKSSFGGPTVRGCQLCLNETGALQSHWLFQRVEICLKHKVPLTILWRETDPLSRYDVASNSCKSPAPDPLTRDITPFEYWLEARLTGAEHDEVWLDNFALGAAVEFCVALGRAAYAHRLRKWRGTPAEIAYVMPAVGFELCLKGEDHLQFALRDLARLTGVPENGPKLIYGGLFDLLAAPDLHEDLRPFRDIFRRHCEATWPLSIGDEVLGEPVLAPMRYALRALAGYWGMETEALREILLKRCVLDETERHADLRWITIGASSAETLAVELNQGLDAPQFCRALGVSQRLFNALRDAGHLDSFRSGETWDAWSAKKLLDPLLFGSETVHVPMHGWRSLGQAAAELGTSEISVLSMIRQGQILRVGRHTQKTGFAAILVDLAGANGHAVSLEVFAAAQGVEVSDLLKLHGCGDLATIELPPKHHRASTKNKRLGLRPKAIQAYHAKFVSHRRLALSLKISAEALQMRLNKHQLAPVHGCRSIYQCRDCAPLHHKDGPKQK